MPYKIAIASGKGGTGKTTVAINLFNYFSKEITEKVTLVDCDVEEPNGLIFLPKATLSKEKIITLVVPTIDIEKCTFCKKCSEYCEFNALTILAPINMAEVNKTLCHSCGACTYACPEEAISEMEESIGTASFYKTSASSCFVEGRLKIGSTMQTSLIGKLKQHIADEENNLLLFDSPPGTSCSVVETISDADFVLLVAEPTLFGLHDLKLMLTLVSDLNLKYAVLINKAGIGNNNMQDYLEKQSIEIIGEIPFDKEYASQYAKGELLHQTPHKIDAAYAKITKSLKQKMLNK